MAERICGTCRHRCNLIGVETGSEDPGEILKACDQPELQESLIGLHGLTGGVSLWTYEDATCDLWEDDDGA